ncbi:MAG: anhydro-N-acetylmuramic acid kinase [Hydrogenovibrio sp.]|nr:anhydro-N-acetylmuramic acid kinase [Hydrogenovibrio sp.]
MSKALYIGLMSGTSLDGIDAALVDFSTTSPKCLEFSTFAYPESLKDALHQLNLNGTTDLSTLARLEYELGIAYSAATHLLLQSAELTPEAIQAIGSHGQTIFHDPNIPMSLQIGHPAFIAKHTRITTVADFRIDDMANLGQGAPLAPAFHKTLFNLNEPTAIVNIGGIANISVVHNGKVIGFDTGPGNGLMDEICQQRLDLPYDQDGKQAAAGTVDELLLKHLQSDPYFSAPYPKSTGRDKFNLNWLNAFLSMEVSTEVLLSTLNQLTANTIADAINRFELKRVILCGGGAENKTLVKRIADQVAAKVETSWDYQINPNLVEAMMMAWLAKKRVHNEAIELSSITGANKDSILGGVWHP